MFSEAVRCRLRSLRPVGATLSGGLDSGSVVGLAGPMLAREGKSLPTFSSVPRFDVSGTVSPLRFGDETPYIRATAEHVGNVEAHLLDSASIGPVEGIIRTLGILKTPAHAASNAYWIVDILENARRLGLGVLLTGQGGNAAISWKGSPWMAPGTAPESLRNWRLRLKNEWVLPRMPVAGLRLWIALRTLGRARDWSHTAIREEFARRLDLAARQPQDIFVKIHDAFRRNPEGVGLVPEEATRGVIYLLRNPLDVAVSYANHVARYEDLLLDPENTFGAMLDFARLDVDPDRLRQALEFTRFDRLKAQDAEKGFKEKPLKSRAFFREGKAGSWRKSLSPRQADQIIAANGEVMQRFGYLTETGEPVY